MEKLGDFCDSLAESLSQQQDGAVSKEFYSVMAGVQDLREATKIAQDKGNAEESEEEDDILAIAWKVEYDLAQFVR